MSARWARISRMHHLSGAGLYRRVLSGRPETAAAICLGLFSAASRCLFSSAWVMDKPAMRAILMARGVTLVRIVADVAFRNAAVIHGDKLRLDGGLDSD